MSFRDKKFGRLLGRMHAKLLHGGHKRNNREAGREAGGERRESSNANSAHSHPTPGRHPSGAGRHAIHHHSSDAARGGPSVEALIAAIFQATGYRMSKTQAARLSAWLGESEQAAANLPDNHGQEFPLPEAPGGIHSSLQETNESGQPGPAHAGPDPGINIFPGTIRAELMSSARTFQSVLNRQNPDLSQADMVELLSLIRRLGQLFFDQGRDKVTQEQLRNEMAELRRLIESKGK